MGRHLGYPFGKPNTLTMQHWHNLNVHSLTCWESSFGPLCEWRRQSAHEGSPGHGKPLLRC